MKYLVTLQAEHQVTVEAANEEEAQELAETEVWFGNAPSDYYVTDVEELDGPESEG